MRPGFPRFARGIVRHAGERWGDRRILGAYSSVAVALEHDIICLPATGLLTDSPLLFAFIQMTASPMRWRSELPGSFGDLS